MKTVLSVCMLTVLLYACTKSNSPAPLDCNGVENGIAAYDDCGVCHQSYVYNYVTHATTYIEDTAGLILGETEMLTLAGSAEDIVNNPMWNNCDDCMGIPNGIAAMDTCGTCYESYIYGGFTHNHSVDYISDTSGLVIEEGYMLILAGSAEDIANNPMWNICK